MIIPMDVATTVGETAQKSRGRDRPIEVGTWRVWALRL